MLIARKPSRTGSLLAEFTKLSPLNELNNRDFLRRLRIPICGFQVTHLLFFTTSVEMSAAAPSD